MQMVKNGEQMVEEFQTQYGRDVDRRKSYGGLGCFHGNESPFYRSRGGPQKVGAGLEPKIGKLATSSVGYGSIKGRSFRSASRKV